MERFSFPVRLTPDPIDGGFVVSFPDLPEAITQGDNFQECLAEATDCLEEAITARMDDNLDIPLPSMASSEEHLVYLPLQTSLKATVYLAMREAKISKRELASLIQLDESEVADLVNPQNNPKLSHVEKVLAALGKRAEINLSTI